MNLRFSTVMTVRIMCKFYIVNVMVYFKKQNNMVLILSVVDQRFLTERYKTFPLYIEIPFSLISKDSSLFFF